MSRTSLKLDDKWIPRSQPGGIYCSPRCGGKCKRAEYDAAVAKSSAMAERLGDGWTARVWENLGWHWSVSKGVMTLHAYEAAYGRKPYYSAWFEPKVQIHHTMLQIICDAETPEDAIGFATQEARTLIRRIEDELAGLA